MIKRLYVNNFRCLQNFELKLDGIHSALLIGKNGSGKSAVRDVLEILQRIAQGENDVNQLFSKTDIGFHASPGIRIDVEVVISKTPFVYQVVVIWLESEQRFEIQEEHLDGVDQEFIERSRPEDPADSTSTSKKEVHRSIGTSPASIGWTWFALPILVTGDDPDWIHTFRHYLASTLIVRPIPQMIAGITQGTYNKWLNPDCGNLISWLMYTLSQPGEGHDVFVSTLRKVLADFQAISDENRGLDRIHKVIFGDQDSSSLTLEFDQLSDGEKTFFICAAIVAANRASLYSHPHWPLVCFWDEPDNYLALNEVGHFVMALRKEFSQGGQFLCTSHNPEAIRVFSDENTFLLQRQSHLEPTVIRPLCELPEQKDLIGSLIRNNYELD